MPEADRFDGLEVSEDMRFERRAEAATRVGWALLAAFILASLLGFFGAGAFSTTTASGSGLSVSYERFVRRGGTTGMEVVVPDASGEVRLWFDRSFVKSMQVESMAPQPDSVEESEGRMVFTIVGSGRVNVTFELRPQQLGRQSGDVGVEGGGTVTVTQFAYP